MSESAQRIAVVDSLAQRAKDFITTLDNQFADTVARGRQRATLLRQRADEIDRECDELETAQANLPPSLEKWIRMERDVWEGISSLANVQPIRQGTG